MLSRIAAFALGLLISFAAGAQGGDGPGPQAVIVTEAVREPLADRIEALGTLQAAEAVVISSAVAETVEKIHFAEGAQVQAGELLVELRHRAERADLAAAKARLAEKRSALARAEELHADGLISAAERDLARAERSTAAAEVEVLEVAIAERHIRAPFAGRLGLREVSPGAYITAGQRITTLGDVSSLRVEFTLPERWVRFLSADTVIEARTPLLPGEVFVPRLEARDSALQSQSRSLRVRARLHDPHPALAPGMLLELSLRGALRQALQVPEAALISRGSVQYVYRIDGDGRAEQREVSTGTRSDGRVEIVTGLDAGDTVIVHGQSKLRPGRPVRIRNRYDGSVPLSELLRRSGGA